MGRDINEDIKQLKRDYFDLEETSRDEKECLIKVINAFGAVAVTRPDLVEEVRTVKEIVRSDETLPIGQIEGEIDKLKKKIISKEGGVFSDDDEQERLHNMEERLLEACRGIRRIMMALFNDFYPLTGEMEAESKTIHIDCKGEPAQIEFTQPTDAFLSFIERIKTKISKDFSFINKTFLLLLEQVKELEKTLTREFGGKDSLKEIEYFEMKINDEVGSIANSFNIYTTINEIRNTVSEKIKNIKGLVSLRKKQEVRKAQIARENIKKLQNRITKAERDASKMSRKAEQFEVAAMKDELTGLYNRRAFDMRVKDALDGLNETGESFSVILFDVDKLKEVNDTLGHVAGDKVLKKVAQCMEQTFRKNDFIARYGGDEFIILIEGLTKEMARERILSFRKNLKKRRFISYKEGEIDVTVSAGIAVAIEGDTPENLLGRADKAMYASKRKID